MEQEEHFISKVLKISVIKQQNQEQKDQKMEQKYQGERDLLSGGETNFARCARDAYKSHLLCEFCTFFLEFCS